MKNVDNKKYIVLKERVEIYKDFTLNLLYYVNEYYLDSETLSTNRDIHNHFRWCFKKVCEEFLDEEIDFTENHELEEYFYIYYYYQFYKVDGNDKSYSAHDRFWRNIFDYEKPRNKTSINLLIELYNIYDNSIESKKNVVAY